jgi:hypothetical protein
MAHSRSSRERRSPPPRGDFVVEPVIKKRTRVSAPAPVAPSSASKNAPLPSQWPAKKRQRSQRPVGAVAEIDNATLVKELERRGLLAPEVFERPRRWSPQEDVLLEDAVKVNGSLFLSDTKSAWHAVAQNMGKRSHLACRKRWAATHPFWSPATDCFLNLSAFSGDRIDTTEHFHVDTLLQAHPADDHYGLMALETFTDTAPDATAEGECVDRRRITTDKMLASYNIRGVHGNGHVAFAFPKRPPGKWDVRLEAEHTLGLHQQRVTSVFLDIRIAQGRTGSA